MRRNLNTAADTAWLAETFRRNRALYGHMTMMADPAEGGGQGSAGDGTQGGTQGGVQSGGQDGDNADPGDSGAGSKESKGYPDNTRVEDMTADQKAAYWQAQARRHEERNRDLLAITGGKFGDDLKGTFDELETLRNEKRTDSERAVEEAKTQTRDEVRKEFGTKLAAAEFRAALAHVDDTRRDQIIEGLALANYLTQSGDVDTDKVKSYAAAIAPADKGAGNGREHDYGAGRRSNDTGKAGISAGAAAYRARHNKTASTNS